MLYPLSHERRCGEGIVEFTRTAIEASNRRHSWGQFSIYSMGKLIRAYERNARPKMRTDRHSRGEVLSTELPMNWSEAAWSAWGKLDAAAASSMPLVRHLEDSAAVACYLWDEFLPDATKRCICEGLAVPDGQGRQVVSWLAGIHDVGKATPAFAAKAAVTMPSVLGLMRDHDLDARPTIEDRLVPHATAGQVVVEEWLAKRYPQSNRRVRNSYASVVGCHHGSTPSVGALELVDTHPAQLGRGRWAEVRDEILDKMAEATGAADHLGGWLNVRPSVPVQVLLNAIVIMADWIASNTDYFPYVGGSTDERLQTAIELLDLPEPWRPAPPIGHIDEFLASRFPGLIGKQARPLQERLVVAAHEVDRPSLFIVEGPMGVGKTEAALLAAEVLAERFGLGGVFVGLPTMATANPMFERVERWLQTSLNGRPASIALAHGKAALNEKYADLVRHSWKGQLFDEDSDDARAAAVVNQWLRGRKRTGLADFVVGTIDQSLFAALKAKHVVLRHLGLVGKVVIIDEVHAADQYMREYLKRLLSWLGAYRTPAILMSATLPPSQRSELLAAYADSSGERLPEMVETDDYPRITVCGREPAPVASDGRELAISLERIPDDLDALVVSLQAALADGGCAAVICNTVARAQEAFVALHETFGNDVRLLHSRFVAPDRARREAELVTVLGPDGSQRPERLIVVGTQVLEQSLDVDFDLMVTDLAPIDLLLQRAGRLHRHDRRSRPPRLSAPLLWLRGVGDWSSRPPAAVPGSRAVYGSRDLLAAAAVLQDVEAIQLPQDIPRLVRVAYDTPDIPTEWLTAWQEAEQSHSTESLKAVGRAQTYLLGAPWEVSNLNGFIDVTSGDPDRLEERGKSQVRDGEDGLEVLALWRGEDGYLRLPEHLTRFPGRVIPEGLQWGTSADDQLAREMAACTVRLPAAMCLPRAIERVIHDLERIADYSGWQDSRWISGQLAIVFDVFGRCRVGGFELSYDAEQGLFVTRLEESHQ